MVLSILFTEICTYANVIQLEHFVTQRRLVYKPNFFESTQRHIIPWYRHGQINEWNRTQSMWRMRLDIHTVACAADNSKSLWTCMITFWFDCSISVLLYGCYINLWLIKGWQEPFIVMVAPVPSEALNLVSSTKESIQCCTIDHSVLTSVKHLSQQNILKVIHTKSYQNINLYWKQINVRCITAWLNLLAMAQFLLRSKSTAT